MNMRMLVLIISLLIGTSLQVFGQSPQQQQSNDVQVIDIEAQILDSRVELPQVQVLDKRKKIKFDEVKVERSFRAELSGKTEEFQFTPKTSDKIKPIKNIEELLNKKRF